MGATVGARTVKFTGWRGTRGTVTLRFGGRVAGGFPSPWAHVMARSGSMEKPCGKIARGV